MCDEDQSSSLKETIAWSDVTPQPASSPGVSEGDTTGSVEQFLAHCRPFSQLPEEIQRQLAAEMIWREYSAGAPVYRQGDLADGLLVIVDGSAEVVLDNESGTEQVLSCVYRDATTLLTKRLLWSLPEQAELDCDISDELYELLDRCLGEPPGRPGDQLEYIESWAGPVNAALLRHVCQPKRPETSERSIESDE